VCALVQEREKLKTHLSKCALYYRIRQTKPYALNPKPYTEEDIMFFEMRYVIELDKLSPKP
jgi:hypothetical protein